MIAALDKTWDFCFLEAAGAPAHRPARTADRNPRWNAGIISADQRSADQEEEWDEDEDFEDDEEEEEDEDFEPEDEEEFDDDDDFEEEDDEF